MKNIKQVLFSTTLCFTLIVFLSTMFVYLDGSPTYAMGFVNICRVLIFSLILGISGLIFNVKKLPYAVARTIHFIALCIDFLVVISSAIYKADFRMNFIAVLLFMVLYWIIIGIIAIPKAVYKKIVSQK